MRMLEAFKRLLNGEKITRSDWEQGEYIEYCQTENKFKVFSIKYDNPVFYYASIIETDIFYKRSEKEIKVLSFLDDTDRGVNLYDDDKNMIYISEEERKELDAFKWRILIYCVDIGCEKCKVNSFCPHVNKVNKKEKELISLSADEIRNFYNLIKVYGNKREGE